MALDVEPLNGRWKTASGRGRMVLFGPNRDALSNAACLAFPRITSVGTFKANRNLLLYEAIRIPLAVPIAFESLRLWPLAS
jgi:hypothetical protein